MGVTFDYYMDGYIDLSEIMGIYERAEEYFPSFRERSRGTRVGGHFSPDTLPAPHSFKGLKIEEITTYGDIKKQNKPLEKLEDILQKGEQIGPLGLVSITWEFLAKGSSDRRRNASFRIEIRDGKKFFGYKCNGSYYEPEHTKQLISQVKTVAGLPITVADSGPDFYLQHSLGDELRVNYCHSPRGENPMEFHCEMKESTVEELFGKMRAAFQEVGTEKYNKFHWGASTGALRDLELSKRIYQHVCDHAFPADKYSLMVDFLIDSIPDVETIRAFCGPKDKLFTEICSFDLSEDNFANVHVITSQLGHRVYFELRLPEDVRKLQDELGVKVHKSFFA